MADKSHLSIVQPCPESPKSSFCCKSPAVAMEAEDDAYCCKQNLQHVNMGPLQPRLGSSGPILIVGNYCHDTIAPPPGGVGARTDTLGGSAAYVLNVLDALRIECEVVSKVGPDFAYSDRVSRPPVCVNGSLTTHFVADYPASQDRILRADKVCEPIHPSDLCNGRSFDLGLAVGVAGEILPETLEKIIELCDRVIVDLQALIRVIDPTSGNVMYQKLEETPFNRLLHRISFLKAAQSESKHMDLESARKRTCVIVTNGDKGSTVYLKNKEFHIPAFSGSEVDPTGAGDSFLGGFTAGLHGGLSIEKAAVLGSYFGALAVSHIGIPKLSDLQIQNSQKIFVGNDLSDSTGPCIQSDRHCLLCSK